MRPKVSVVVPIHNMQDGDKFLWRLVNSLTEQTFKDWELIITKNGKMAENTNAAIKRARGEFIKVLYLDDYFAYPDALRDMVKNFRGHWQICGANTNPHPSWNDRIGDGKNTLGSPSALMMRRGLDIFFDERLSWLLDCDLYKRLNDKYGPPQILDGPRIMIGVGDHQMTNILTKEEKILEYIILRDKYEND